MYIYIIYIYIICIIIIIIIIIILFYLFIFSPTSTKPVGLKISYYIICWLRWFALGKKLRLGGKCCGRRLYCYRHPLVQICCLERLVGYCSDPSSRSSMNSANCGHHAPLVSMATGTKECVAARATYFVVL